MTLDPALIATALLTILGLIIMIQDWRSLEISAWHIYLFFGLSLGLGALAPLPGLTTGAHMLAAGLAFALPMAIRIYFKAVRKIDGLGEADVWLFAAGGAMIGPYLLGPWIFLTCFAGAILLLLPQSVATGRAHPDDPDAGAALPLTPLIIATSLALQIILRAEILAANYLPLP